MAFIRDGDLYIVDSDGGREIKITNAEQPYIRWAGWLADGSLVFYYLPPSPWSVYSANPDGSDSRLLAHGFNPQWSPDDREITFESFTGFGSSITQNTYVMNTNGSGKRTVSEFSWNDVWFSRCGGPPRRFSPSGDQYAYAADEFPDDDVASCDVFLADDQQKRPAIALGSGAWPVWSPDDQSLAFVLDGRLYVSDRDGSNRRQITPELRNGFGAVKSPAWAPDGDRIAVSSAGRLLVVDIHSEDITEIGACVSPSWSKENPLHPVTTPLPVLVEIGPKRLYHEPSIERA